MRRILFEQTDFNTLPNPPAGFQYIGFNGPTFSQKDNNGDTTQPGGGGVTELVELTYSEAIDLLSGQDVVEGTRYLITGFDVDLYGGTDILVNGLLNSQFSVNGYGKFYNPNYGSMSVWNPTIASYSVDTNVIYGGKVWKNLTGSIGSNDNIFTLDGKNWELQDDYTNTDHYIAVWDQIEMSTFGLINSRYDSYRNNYVRVGQLDSDGNDRWFFCGVNPIAAFGWGNDNINDCNIKDSYFNCLNIIGTTTIYGVEMSNYSFMFDTTFKDSTIESLRFENESGCFTLNLDNSTFRSSNLDNNSNITGEFNSNSTIENLNLSNNSYMYDLIFYSSYLRYLNLDNNSTITNISASSSYFQNINMTNNSWISNIELTSGGGGNSYFERVDLSNRSYITNVELYNSTMYEIKFDNYSYMQGNPHIDLYNNSSMTYISLDNHSHISQNIGLTGSSYFKRIDMTNRSRIEGPIDFQNNSRIEKMYATNDSYINTLYFNGNTYVEDLNMNNSTLENINLNDSQGGPSSIISTSLDRSNLTNLTGESIVLVAYDLNISALDFQSLGTVSNLTPLTSAKLGDYKYISAIEMDGTEGYGLTNSSLNIGTMLVPQGSYIERLSINCSELVYSGDSATFSFGISGLKPSLEVSVSEITNKTKVFDLSNELLNGSKSVTDTILSADLSGGTNITSGTIYLEITLKISIN
jgi:hypothetical protein